jgi:hypothetical protein
MAYYVAKMTNSGVRLYPHCLAYHAHEMEEAARCPLGTLSNQIFEHSHHDHKLSFIRHTFRLGWRWVPNLETGTGCAVCCDVIRRKWQ